MIDKEKILACRIDEHPFQGMEESEQSIALDAMEEYATLVMEDFLSWMEVNFLVGDGIVLPRIPYSEVVQQYLNEKTTNKD
jgi:hypothetical protein